MCLLRRPSLVRISNCAEQAESWMNLCTMEQSALVAPACENSTRNSISAATVTTAAMSQQWRMETLVCPKPRRLGDQIKPRRCHTNCRSELNDLKAVSELLDIMHKGSRARDGLGCQVSSSPPFFCGSPPNRVSNPVIQDEHFGAAVCFPSSPSVPASPSSATRMAGGCARVKFGQKPAAVRIEGFDCLNRDRQNCSISAVA